MRLTREVFASAESSLAAKNSEGEWTREQRGESLDPGEEVPGAALGGPQRGGIDPASSQAFLSVADFPEMCTSLQLKKTILG